MGAFSLSCLIFTPMILLGMLIGACLQQTEDIDTVCSHLYKNHTAYKACVAEFDLTKTYSKIKFVD